MGTVRWIYAEQGNVIVDANYDDATLLVESIDVTNITNRPMSLHFLQNDIEIAQLWVHAMTPEYNEPLETPIPLVENELDGSLSLAPGLRTVYHCPSRAVP